MSNIHLPLAEIELPLELESVFIVQAWHPRLDRDPAHRWLRQTIKQFFCKGSEGVRCWGEKTLAAEPKYACQISR